MLLGGFLAAFLTATAPLTPTFSHDVAPILYRHCATCHHPGAIAPFSLLTYREAKTRAGLIAAVTRKRTMPPWLPDSTSPRFQHERRLTAAEIATLARWASAGAPRGNPAVAPAPPQFPNGWQLGKPDFEVEMRSAFSVPANGHDLYQCFALTPKAAGSHWVRAIDMKPGNPKVVHHALLFQDISGTARRRDHGQGYSCFGTPGFLPARGLGGWTPGAIPFVLPAGSPELLDAGADLVLQVHYHPDGKPENDHTRIALYFTSRRPTRRVLDIPLDSSRIDIPPGDANYKVTDHFTIPVAVEAIAINPHAHYVCKDMLGYAVLPNGGRRTLIHIPDWNFNWQQQYTYAVPVRLPAGTTVVMEFTYDNSAANPRNPNHPPRRVVWGPSSTDEMAGLHIEVTPVNPKDADELSQALWGKMIREIRGWR